MTWRPFCSLWRQTSPKLSRVIPDSFLPRPLPILRGEVTCTLWPADLYAQSETTLDSRPLSYRTHPQDPVYFVEEFLCSRTLGFFCASGIGLIRLAVAWKPFPKLYCVLNMLAVNHLAQTPCSLIQADKVNLHWVFILTSFFKYFTSCLTPAGTPSINVIKKKKIWLCCHVLIMLALGRPTQAGHGSKGSLSPLLKPILQAGEMAYWLREHCSFCRGSRFSPSMEIHSHLELQIQGI